MPNQDGISFLFDITDKITAKLAKIEAKVKSSATKINSAFTKASKAQQAHSAKVIHTEKMRGIAVESATAKATAARTKEAQQGAILAQRLSAAQSSEARKSAAAEQRRISTVDKAHAKSVKLLKSQTEAFKRSMTRLASASAVAFAAVAGKAIQMAGGYDAAMRSVQAKTGATGAVLDKLSEQAREMGRTTVHSATEAARGQAFLAQAGFDANEILEALPGTLALATAGELDLASSADIASNVLSGFRLETSETGRVVDVLAAISAKTNTNVTEMGDALAKAAPAAAAAGWSLEETAAAIGRLSDAGIKSQEAGTVLKTMLARLAAPTGKLGKLMTEVGVNIKDATGKMLPLNDIIGQLAPHAENTGLMFELLGTKGANAGLVLGALGEENLRELTSELENSEGAAQRMADIMGGGLWGAIKKIQSIVESAYISLGERFGPAVEKAANLFAKLPAPIQEVIVVAGSLAGAMGGLMLLMPQSFGALVQFPGKLLGLVKILKSTTAVQWLLNAAMTANPIGLVIAAVALLAGGIYLLWKRYKKLQKTFDAAAATTEDLTDRYDDLTEKVADAEAQLELVRKGAVRSHPLYAKKLRALEDERAELELHIKQRAEAAEAAKWFAAAEKKAAGAVKKLAEAEAKSAKAREKAAKKVEAAEKAAAEAAEKSAKAVQDLADSWTGATVKSGRFLGAYKKLTPEQKKNDRIMGKVLTKYDSLREVLGPFNEELEAQWQATERLNPVLAAQRKETEKLEAAAKKLAEEALAELTKEQERLEKAAEDLNDRLEGQRRHLLNIPADDAIRDFAELTQTWEGLNDAVKQGDVLERYGELLVTASEAGHELNAAQIAIVTSTEDVEEVMEEATASASGYDLALAGIAGQMGGTTGQALNLVIAMREHNKAQDAAAAAGEKTEGKFSKIRMGAALLSTAFSAIGEAIGGTAGKVLSELGGIASAFATGGIVGGIMAGIGSLVKGIAGLFGRGKRKREAAAKKEAAAAKIVADAAAAAAKTHAEAIEVLRRAWLSIPTDQIVLDLTAIRDAWDALGVEDRTVAFDDYVASLISARDAGAELTAAELNVITLFEEHQSKRTAMLARHQAEMAGFDSQIAALESLLQTKISEVDALIAQQEAELTALSARQDSEIAAMAARRATALGAISARQDAEMSALLARQEAELGGLDTQIDALESRLHPKISELQMLLDTQEAELAALSARQDAEIAALAARRKASLDAIMAAQGAQLSLLKKTQSKELADMKAAQAAELSALKSARAAALGVVESAIQRELEDERIAAQLKIDLRKAGGDQEAIDAANLRAEEATANLLERDELNGMMAEAEARVRARYKDELDTLAAHWDTKEALTTERHLGELTDLETAHANELTALETAHALELTTHRAFWDAKELYMGQHHAGELTALETAHTEQLQVLLDSLTLRRDALAAAHTLELTALKAAHVLEMAEHNTYWDDLEELMALRHGVELDNLNAAHAAQLEALMASLVERRDTLRNSHATELSDLDDFHDAKIRAILAAQVAERDARRTAEIKTQIPDDTSHEHDDFGYDNHDPWHAGDYHEHDDFDFRQHGGPVSAGRRYMVGEAGPEMFVPSQGGRIEPNGSSSSGVDAKALGRAVADALEGTEIKVDGRKLGRLTVRHQPLAIAELGGRR